MQRPPVTNKLFTREIQPPEESPDWSTVSEEQELHNKCTDYINRQNGPESANHHYVFSRDHLLAELTDQGIRYFKRNLLEFSLQPGFNRIPPHFLEFIVDSDDLIILDPGDWRAMNTEEREVAVLGIVLKYLTVNRLENDHMGEDLMKSVRLLDIDPYRVMQVIEEYNFSSHSAVIKRLIDLGEMLRTHPQVALDDCHIPESWSRRRVLARWQTDNGDSSPASATPPNRLDDLEISKITIANGKLFHRDFLYLVAVKYRHYITKVQCYIDKIGPNNYEQGHYTVKLGDDEHIVKCSYGIENEHLVSLTFETNIGNVYGPFQASVTVNCEDVVEEGSNEPTTYLHKLEPKTLMSQRLNKPVFAIGLEWIKFS